MKTFKEFIFESSISNLEQKLKETSDESMRETIQKQINAMKEKLSKH